MYNTVSLEVAKKLKEAGWGKETYFYSPSDQYVPLPHVKGFKPMGKYIAMPQLHEVLEDLPEKIETPNGIRWIHFEKCYKYNTSFVSKYTAMYKSNTGESTYFISHLNPHDAAALLWIWCVENNYITL